MATHKDVNLEPNWAVIYEYLDREGAGLRDELFNFLPPELAQRCEDMSRARRNKRFHFKYPDTWESLATWKTIENALIAVLGHGAHLREVGRYSRFAAFGLDALKASFVGSKLGRAFTSPADGNNNVRFVAKRCIRNKTMYFVQTAQDAGFIVMRHHREIADPLDDFWSVTSFIPGFGDAVNLFWEQNMDERSQSTVIAVGIQRLLDRYVPDAYVKLNGKLFVDGIECGSVAYITPHESGFVLSEDDALYIEREGSIPIVRITKNIETVCSRCSKDGREVTHPVLRAGHIVQYSDQDAHHLPNSAFSVYWQKKWVDRVRGVSSRFVMRKTIERAQTEVELTEARHQLMSVTDFLERSTPTKKIASELAHGTLTPFVVRIAVLQSDVVGFTEMVERHGMSETEQQKLLGGKVMNEFRIARPLGGWAYKSIGDCAVIPFCADWPRYENEELKCQTINQAAANANQAASLMHRASGVKGLQVRIGIHVDTSRWSDISREGLHDGWVDPDASEKEFFEGGGDAFNKAARLEKCAQPGCTAISEEVLRLICGDGMVNMARRAFDRGQVVRLKGFAFQGRITVKGGEIDVWTRRELFLEELPKSIDGVSIDDIDVLPGAQELWDETHDERANMPEANNKNDEA